MSERPDQTRIHEAEEGRAREVEIADAFAKEMNYKVWHNPALSASKAVFYSAETRLKAAAAEVIYCDNRKDAFPAFVINAVRLDQLWKQSQKADIKAFLIVKWVDEICFLELRSEPGWKGADVGMYHIPISLFIPLAKAKPVVVIAPIVPDREWKHEEYCAGCYEVEPGKKIHPPYNGGPHVLTEEEIYEWRRTNGNPG